MNDVAEKVIIPIGAMARIPKTLVNMERLRKILTIVSKDTSGYGEDVKIPLYIEHYNEVEIPRYYALKIFSSHPNVEFEYSAQDRFMSDFPEFDGKLRPVQEKLLPNALEQILKDENRGGILNLAVGAGKTISALWLASQIKQKTLVIVHKEFLMDQWIERILGNPAKGEKAFLPGARVGKIQQNVCDYKDKHIVLGMVHSLAMKDDYPSEIYNEFGLIIADELHRLAAAVFSQAMPKFDSLYRVGLSATLKRKDNTEPVFLHAVGPVVAVHDVENLAPKIKRVYLDEVKLKSGKDPTVMGQGRLISFIAKNHKRNMIIVDQIVRAVTAGRKIIVMSHRLEQLDALKNLIETTLKATGDHLKYSIGKYVGGMPQQQLDISAEKDIILSTYNMTSEGLDVPALDTMVFATPMSSVHQSIGRILRAYDGKKEPVVVDLVDRGVGLCMGMYRKRLKFYESKNWV